MKSAKDLQAETRHLTFRKRSRYLNNDLLFSGNVNKIRVKGLHQKPRCLPTLIFCNVKQIIIIAKTAILKMNAAFIERIQRPLLTHMCLFFFPIIISYNASQIKKTQLTTYMHCLG